MPEPRGTRRDDFVAKIVKDPKQPPQAIVLTGFLGDSSEAGHTRLYFDQTLSRYVDLPDTGILHAEPLPKEHSPLGGHTVWVDRNAELATRAASGRVPASFLQGPLTQNLSFTAGTGGAAGMAGQGQHLWPQTISPTALMCCQPQSHLIPCASDLGMCYSVNRPCPSVPLQHCRSLVDVCASVNRPCLSLNQHCHSIPLYECSTLTSLHCNSQICPTKTDYSCHTSLQEICVTRSGECQSLAQCPSIAGCPSFAGCPSLACGGGTGPLIR